MRLEAGRRMGLGDVTGSVIPKVGLLSASRKGGTITSRYLVPDSCHRSHSATGALCVAAASRLEGTVAFDLAAQNGPVVEIEHPGGKIPIALTAHADGVSRAEFVRTARRIFEGNLLVPARLFARRHKTREGNGIMISRRKLTRAAAAAALVAAIGAPAGAFAQADFPNRPLKLLVPYAAGGGTDAIARLVAQAVSEKLGQTMIVENNGTAGGNIASQQAASAPPDGYTVLMANQGPMVVNPHLFKNMKLDPLTAFEPVTLITSAPLALVVPAKSNLKTVQEFLDFAKKNPGKLTYGSAGNGSASHLATVLLAQIAGLSYVHVPYRGAGPALNDLVSGQTDFMITTMPSVAGLIEAGTVRALAITTTTRAPSLPDVPTLDEAGAKGYDSGAWYGFVVPKGTPAPIIAKLRQATIEAINTDLVKSRFRNEGAVPIGSTPEEFRKMMEAESKRWAEVVKAANISIQ